MAENTIKHRGLTASLYKIGKSPFYRMRFLHPQTRQRQRISLGTSDLTLAKAKAKHILGDTAERGITALKDHARKDSSRTVGAAIEHYERVTKVTSHAQNVNALKRLLRLALDASDDQVKAKHLSVLTPALIAKYRRLWEGSPYSLRSTLAGARSVFCHPLDWQGFELPENIAAFAKATGGMRAHSSSFVRIPEDTLQKMEESSKAIGGAIRRAFLLTRYLGMTPKEVSACRRGWIEGRDDGRRVIVVVERSDEGLKLKTGSKRGRVMALPGWIAEELLAADDYMIGGNTPGVRKNYMLRAFNAWVREFLPNRRSAAYELRRQAGSDMLNATGKISVVQHMLGHTEPSTTARWYTVYDREVDVAAVWDKSQ